MTLSLAIVTQDKSSNVIEKVGNSFNSLKAKIEVANKSLSSAKGGFLNLTAGMGGLITIINTGIQIFKSIDNILKNMGGGVKEQWGEIKAVFDNLFNIILKNAVKIIIDITNSFKNFLKDAKNIEFIANIVASLTSGFVVFKEALTVIVNIIKNNVIKAFEDVKASFSNLSKENDSLTIGLSIVKGVVLAVATVFSIIISIIKLVIVAIIDFVNVCIAVGDVLKDFFTGNWANLPETAKKAGEAFKNLGVNIKDNFVGIFTNAVDTFKEADKNFDIEKIKENVTKTFNNTKKETGKALKEITNTTQQANKEILDDNLIFTETLKKQYEEYIKIKKDLIDKNYTNEQEYFDKLSKLKELEKIKGVKELEEYYKARQENNQKIAEDAESLFFKIAKTFEKIDITNFIVKIEDGINKIISDVSVATSSLATNIVKIVAQTTEELKEKKWVDMTQFEKAKLVVSNVMQTIASVISASAQVVNSVFSYYTNEIQKRINEIENSYEKLFKKLEKMREDELNLVKEQLNKQLEEIGLGNKTELEKAQEKLEELRQLREDYRNEETEQRLLELENYYQSLDNKTDKEIQAAYEIQKAKIMETDNKKKADLDYQIFLQQQEIQKQLLIEQAKIKEDEINKKYQAKEEEARKKRQAELNEAERQIFEANKANQIANVWMQMAVGTATIWATAMQLGPIAGAAFAGVLTGLLATVAGIQTGVIASQQYTPKNYATGGVVVGEAGRELVQLPRGAYVYNNDQTERIMGEEMTIINNIFIDSEKITEIIQKKRLRLLTR